MKFKLILALAAALTLAACGQQAEAPAQQNETPVAATVKVENAWCRPTPNGAKVAGCYVTLTASTDDVLTGLTTELADMPQVHEMKHEDGMMKMAHLEDGLPLAAHTPTELKPGSNHIMLMGLKGPLVEGQTAAFTLNFKNAPSVTVEAQIHTPPIVDSEE